MTSSAAAIEALSRSGLVVRASEPETETARQLRSLESLLRSAEHGSGRMAFLNHYDAMMRIVELALLADGYRLGDQPHLATRKLVAALCGETSLRSMVDLRHAAKKRGASPTQADIDELVSIRTQLAERTGLSHLLGDRGDSISGRSVPIRVGTAYPPDAPRR